MANTGWWCRGGTRAAQRSRMGFILDSWQHSPSKGHTPFLGWPSDCRLYVILHQMILCTHTGPCCRGRWSLTSTSCGCVLGPSGLPSISTASKSRPCYLCYLAKASKSCSPSEIAHRGKKAGPFFLFAYADEEVVVVRGKSGGIAFWQRCSAEWELKAGVTTV